METFYINTGIRKGDTVIVTDPSEVRHAFSSLRIKNGEEVYLINGKGIKFLCRVLSSEKKKIVLDPVKKIDSDTEYNDIKLSLAVSVLNKNSKMKLLVEKLTELGIYEFIPFISERTAFPKMNLKGIRASMVSALKQCGGTKEIKIHDTVSLKELTALKDFTAKYYADASAEKKEPERPKEKLLAVIGPEGGFTEKELKEMKHSGFEGLRLNKRILRAETAAIVTASKFLN